LKSWKSEDHLERTRTGAVKERIVKVQGGFQDQAGVEWSHAQAFVGSHPLLDLLQAGGVHQKGIYVSLLPEVSSMISRMLNG
jgi:hypothetical protein